MTDEEMLASCKAGLNIPPGNTVFDIVLKQKLMAVKGYMAGAGVSEEKIISDLSVGAIVVGVTDLWNIQGGEIKFSPVFHTLVTQLAIASLPPPV